jgi:hypothetical protein
MINTNRVVEIIHDCLCSGERSVCSGTGYLVRDNLILTAQHVLTCEQCKKIQTSPDVRFYGDTKAGRTAWQEASAFMTYTSEKHDISLLLLSGKPTFLSDTPNEMDSSFGVFSNDAEKVAGQTCGFPSVLNMENTYSKKHYQDMEKIECN